MGYIYIYISYVPKQMKTFRGNKGVFSNKGWGCLGFYGSNDTNNMLDCLTSNHIIGHLIHYEKGVIFKTLDLNVSGKPNRNCLLANTSWGFK